MKQKNITTNALLNGIKTIVTLAFPIITFMYSSRILLSEGVGKINFSKSFAAYFTILAMLGVVNYGTKEASRIITDKVALSRFAHEILMINAVSTIMAYMVFLFAIQLDVFDEYKLLLYINSISIVLTPLGMDWLYNATEEYAFITIRTCLVQGIGLICILLFIHNQQDIYIYALIQTLAATGANLANFIHSRKLIIYKWLGNYNLKKHIKPILTLFGMTLFIQIFTHLDTTMVGLISGDNAVGLYTAANKMSSMTASVITALVMVLMPRIAHYAHVGNTKEIKKLSEEAINCVLMLGLPTAVGVLLLSTPIIWIFSGRAFWEAVLTSRILAWRILLVPLNSFLVLYLFIPIDRERWALVSTGAAALINFILNSVWIPAYMQNGAAVATVMAELVELFINFYFLRKIMSLKPIGRYVFEYVGGCAYMLLMYGILSKLIAGQFLLMIATIVICGLGYIGILYFLKNPYLYNFIYSLKRKLAGKMRR